MSTTQEESDHVHLNIDVISDICSWLPLKDIKNCRLVSKMWDAGASPVLKSETRISFDCKIIPNKKEINRTAKRVKDMAKFGNPFYLRIDFGVYKWNEDFNDSAFAESIALLKQFTFLRRLKFCGDILRPCQNEFLGNILLDVSKSVTHLEFDLYYYLGPPADHLEYITPEFLTGKQLIPVKKLDISTEIREELLERWTNMLTAFPSVEELSVLNPSCLKNVGAELLKCLKKLRVTHPGGEGELESLQNFNKPLKELTLYGVGSDKRAGVHLHLYTVLSKYHNTLESLALELSSFTKEFANSVWKLPTFPNLKRFKLYIPSLIFDDDPPDDEEPCPPSDDDRNFDICLDTENLNISTNFPQLREFGLMFGYKWQGEWIRCFDSLFSDNGKEILICGGVTEFDIRDQFDHPTYMVSTTCNIFKDGGDIDERFARILKIFPKAGNKFMQDLNKYFEEKESTVG